MGLTLRCLDAQLRKCLTRFWGRSYTYNINGCIVLFSIFIPCFLKTGCLGISAISKLNKMPLPKVAGMQQALTVHSEAVSGLAPGQSRGIYP